MAITVKHKFVSAIPDAGDPNIVQPSNWNDDHELTGTIPVANGGTGASTLTGYVKGNGTAAMTASATVPSTDITGLGTMSAQNANSVAITGGTMSGVAITGYIPTTEKAQPLGVATLDAGGKVPTSQIPMQGDLNYQGTWNAATNTPTLASGTGTKGYYYVVDVAGTTNLDGITDWQIGDWAIFNGTVWQKVDNTDAVTSVNGQVGTVVLTASSVGAVPTTRTITAGTGLTGGGDLSADRTFAIDSTVATLTGTQTLTNKTLTSPKINEILDANGNEVLGLLSTASATDYLAIKNGIGVGVPLHISSEGSSANIGLHIQPKGTGLVTISDGTDFNKGIRFRSSGSAANAITLLDAVSTAGHVVTLPDATTTLVGRGTTDTLTNKSISGSTNTLSNIGNASLTNSAITINGTSTSLGGSINVGTVTSVDLTASTGISVSGGPITGSGSITVTNTAPDQTVVLTAGTGISTSGTYPNFTITNTSPSLGGDVAGPSSATDNAVARFDTTTGKLIQNSLVIIDDTGSVTGVNALTAESLTVNNNATLGSSNTDTLEVNARITTDLEPNTDAAKDIGTSGRNWRDGFFSRNLQAEGKVVSPHFDALNSAGGSLRNSSGTAQLQWGAGGGNNLSVDVAININPANAQVAISPTGTGSVTMNPATAGTINNMAIGGTTAAAGSFTNLSVTGTTSFDGSQGTSGQFLTSQGAGNTPIWTTGGSGTVTSITAGTGLTGGTITTSGTIAIDSTVVTTTGSYANPSWITSLDGSKITGTLDGGSF
jgi:hypothetical protein